jgi:mutator protein MutT
VYLLLIENTKVLLSRRFKTSFGDGMYSLPAGHVEENETPTQALVRESKEEINIDLATENIHFAHSMFRFAGDRVYVDYFFIADKYSGEIVNNEPNKCDDLAWFDIENLPDNTLDYVKLVLKNYKQGVTYSEFGK